MSTSIKENISILCGAITVVALTAYSPKVGSKKWYYHLMGKPKGD